MASGGTEGAVKIWDLRAGKMMCEFNEHTGPIYDVEFHPHEFLLASASADRTVNFWDLENFNLVSKSEKDSGPIRYNSILLHCSMRNKSSMFLSSVLKT